MTIKMAKKVSKFLKNNEVHSVNLMGGEIFCNPHWKKILDLIIPTVTLVRIVSNGDWVTGCPDFAKYLTKFDNCYVSISKDQWHDNKNVDKAIEVLKENNILFNTPKKEDEEFNLVPIGRAQFSFGLFSMFGSVVTVITQRNNIRFLLTKLVKFSSVVSVFGTTHQLMNMKMVGFQRDLKKLTGNSMMYLSQVVLPVSVVTNKIVNLSCPFSYLPR